MQADTRKMRRERLEEQRQNEKLESFKFMEDIVYGHVSQMNRWPTAYFTESGQARLGAIAGWLNGLAMGGQKELAVKLAHDFVKRMNYVTSHRDEEITVVEEDGQERVLKFPQRKVVLGDDGTLHGFRVMFYCAILPKEYNEAYNAEYKKLSENEDGGHIYEMAKYKAKRKLGMRDGYVNGRDMDETRYHSAPTGNALGPSSKTVRYGYSHNGGLLYHGPGRSGNLFAVTLGDVQGWSLHT